MISMNPLMMVSIFYTSPFRLVTPFTNLDRRTAIAAHQQATTQRGVIDTPTVATFFHATPIEWVICAFCRHHFATAYWAFMFPVMHPAT
jgi:hypothetical protein